MSDDAVRLVLSILLALCATWNLIAALAERRWGA